MNLNQIMGMVGRLSDQQLAMMMRENDVVPDFIVASELQRRKDMRDRAATDPPTVAQSLAEQPEAYADGGYVRAPTGYRPGFDPEYDAWRRRGFTFDPSLVTPPGQNAAAAEEAARRAAQQQQGGGLEALAVSAGLGLLPRLPSIYRGVRDLFGPGSSADADLPLPPEFLTEEQAAALYGAPDFSAAPEFAGAFNDLPLPPEFLTEAEAAALTDLPGYDLASGDGFSQMGVSPDEFVSVSDTSGAALDGAVTGATNWAGLPTSFTSVEPGILGSIGGVDIFANAAYAPAAIFGQGMQSLAKDGSEMNATIGSTLGGIIGGIVGGPWGAALGTIAGGGIGGQIGPAPTVGRNFGVTGTIGGDGRISWSGPGGDNGGDAGQAMDFANWLGDAVQQRAGQYGLTYNPAMEGVQFNVGGYDNPTRGGVAPGGYFYDPMRGGSPENYALRPGGGQQAYSQEQANTFADAVLADFVARGIYTEAGGQARDRGFYDRALGADLGWYGPMVYGPNGWEGAPSYNDLLASRRGAIDDWIGREAQRASEYQSMVENQNRMYYGEDGGVLYREPAGETQVSWQDSA